MDKVFMFLATGAGSGYLPKMPGTWGSVVGVLLGIGLHQLPVPWYWLITLAVFVVGVAAAGAAEKIVDNSDPSIVVIDEIAGQLVAMAFVPCQIWWLLASFVLFRFFDILKPFPVGWLDSHLHGGLGIMLDDVAAGIYAALVLALVYWLV